ncbi:MAG TPA: serine hydrolase domain-containing protein [Pseudoxanthomonas sp.]|nr:serine hydrolase domain-containing protein [Pseudoxanthomonas sp.]
MSKQTGAYVRWLTLPLLAGIATLLWWQRYQESLPPESLEMLMQREQIPNAVIAVRTAKGTTRLRVINRLAAPSEDQATTSTQWPIASLSKPITASVVRHLIAQGALSLDTPAITWLPELAKTPDPRYAHITIRHLLQHTSGLDQSRGDPMFRADVPIGCAGAIAVSLKHKLRAPPGSRMQYSNTGYCMLGEIIARITGESYETATRRVLGVKRPGTLLLGPDAASAQQGKDLSANFARSLGAAGGWFSSAATLATLYALDARDASIPTLTTAPHGDWYYGLGWRVWPKGQTYRLTHFGDLPGMFAAAVAYPDGSSAVVLMDGRAKDAETFATAVYYFLELELTPAQNEPSHAGKPSQ